MNAWPEIRCPSCLTDDSIPMNAGGRLCLQCRHEWNPDTTTGPLDNVHELGDEIARRAELVNATPAETADLHAQLQAAREAFVGHDVIVHDAEAIGVVVTVLDNGYAVVEFGSGYQVACTPDEFSLVPGVEVDEGAIVELGAIDLSVAATVIRAAIGSFVEDADGRRIGLAPNGWLVQDVEAWPIVEHGAAYAVAIIADLYGVTTAQLTDIADKIEHNAALAAEGGHTT